MSSPWPNFALRSLCAINALLPGGVRHAEAERILVYRMGNLGDIVVALPAFHALRRHFPGAKITLITSPTKRGAPSAQEVLAKDDTFDDMIVYYEDESSKSDFLRAMRQRLSAARFDLAVLLPGDRATAMSLTKQVALLATAGIRHIVGARVISAGDYRRGQVPRTMDSVASLCGDGIEDFPWIRHDADDEAHVATLLPETTDGPLIGMQCGAKRPANRWMADRFVALGKRLVEEHKARLILTGSAGESALLSEIAVEISAGCVNLAGKTTIPELAVLAARCDAFISNDTGTMHVAACMGTPVVAIFSGRDDEHRWYPYGDQHTVLRHSPDCSPCLEDTCPLYDDPICLSAHEVDDVFAAVTKVLG
ncbi:MAG: glycosyltransferase family 9 protein [Candidatus Hydrogenedentes bacterium]|nr:glycosyltransferase family 9 protein [Candidatus Hydrogenedentota bacterium]